MNDRKVGYQNPPSHQPNLDPRNSRGYLLRAFTVVVLNNYIAIF